MNSSFEAALTAWKSIDKSLQTNLITSAESIVKTIFDLEPMIVEKDDDKVELLIQPDVMGEVGDARTIVFPNLKAMRECDIDWKAKENWILASPNHWRWFCGCDYGYSPDPTVGVVVGYNRIAKVLWIIDECCGTRWSEEAIAFNMKEMLSRNGGAIGKRLEATTLITPSMIINSEIDNRIIDGLRGVGLNIYPIKKFSGSRDVSYQFLTGGYGDLREIWIDSEQCKTAWAEFVGAEFPRRDINGKEIIIQEWPTVRRPQYRPASDMQLLTYGKEKQLLEAQEDCSKKKILDKISASMYNKDIVDRKVKYYFYKKERKMSRKKNETNEEYHIRRQEEYKKYKEQKKLHNRQNAIELGIKVKNCRISDYVKNKILSGKTKILVNDDGSIIQFRKRTDNGYWVNTSINKGEVIYLHRETLRRYLKLTKEQMKGYDVHHIDGNKDNNDISNLQLLNKTEHKKIHSDSSKWSEDRLKKARRRMDYAREYANLWHKSQEGREWHKEQWKNSLGKYQNNKIKKKCKYCGNEYEVNKSNASTSKFCSNKCKSAYRRASGVDNVERVCAKCGNIYLVNKYSNGKLCRKCSGK